MMRANTMTGKLMAGIAFLALISPAAYGNFISDGSILNDDFLGNSLDADTWVDTMHAGPSSLTVGGSVLTMITEINNADRAIFLNPTNPLDYDGQTDPAYEIRFQAGDGDLGSGTREFNLLTGNTPDVKFSLSLCNEGGNEGFGCAGAPNTDKFDLNWGGMAEGGIDPELITTLDRHVWYSVMAVFQSAASGYDIYLDGALIDTKPAINAGLADILRSGDTTGDAQMDPYLVDYIRVGALSTEIGEGPRDFTWKASGSGLWNAFNWNPSSPGPNGFDNTVIFAGSISAPSTVVVDTPVTVNRIEFDNSTAGYILGGHGGVNLFATTDPNSPVSPTLAVQAGTHEFQTAVSLHGATTANIASGSTLTFNNALNLLGRTLTKTGDGTLAINNVLNTGGGTLDILQGTVTGHGIVGGDMVNDGGTISPGGGIPSSNGVVPEPAAAVLLLVGIMAICLTCQRHVRHLPVRFGRQASSEPLSREARCAFDAPSTWLSLVELRPRRARLRFTKRS